MFLEICMWWPKFGFGLKIFEPLRLFAFVAFCVNETKEKQKINWFEKFNPKFQPQHVYYKHQWLEINYCLSPFPLGNKLYA